MANPGSALFKDAPGRGWYGWDNAWRSAVERDCERFPQLDLSVQMATDWAAYWMTLDIPGRTRTCEAVAVFAPVGRIGVDGLRAMDWPTVYGDLPARMPGLLPYGLGGYGRSRAEPQEPRCVHVPLVRT